MREFSYYIVAPHTAGCIADETTCQHGPTLFLDAEDYYHLTSRIDMSRFEGRLTIVERSEIDEVAVTGQPDVLRELNAHAAASSWAARDLDPELLESYASFCMAFEELYEDESLDAAVDMEPLLPLYGFVE